MPDRRFGSDTTVLVWDAPIRVVHWTIAALLAVSWYTAEVDLMEWHRWSGYAVLALLLFRIIWGFIGSSTARFFGFVRGPSTVWRHAGTLLSREPTRSAGHNPLGALSVLALLAVLILQVATGLFAVDVDGIESGPLSDRVSFDTGRWLAGIHEACFTALQVLVVLHIVAIVFYLGYKRDNLIGPMITGRRRGDFAGMVPASSTRVLVAVVLSVAFAWFVSNGLRL